MLRRALATLLIAAAGVLPFFGTPHQHSAGVEAVSATTYQHSHGVGSNHQHGSPLGNRDAHDSDADDDGAGEEQNQPQNLDADRVGLLGRGRTDAAATLRTDGRAHFANVTRCAAGAEPVRVFVPAAGGAGPPRDRSASEVCVTAPRRGPPSLSA